MAKIYLRLIALTISVFIGQEFKKPQLILKSPNVYGLNLSEVNKADNLSIKRPRIQKAPTNFKKPQSVWLIFI